MADVHSPLCQLLGEINKAAHEGMPLLAIAMTVALPDICVSLASSNGRSDSGSYKAWCDKNLPKEQFGAVTSEDLYSMRCGVLHNGRFGDLKHNVSRVIFIPPNAKYSAVNCIDNDAFTYSVTDFCGNFCNAVHRWMEANIGDPKVQANLPRLMQYRKGGLMPYIIGLTVLA